MRTERTLPRRLAIRGIRPTLVAVRSWVTGIPASLRVRGLVEEINDAFHKHEAHGRRVAAIMISAREYSLLRRSGRTDPRTDKAELDSGWMADMWGARVLVRREMVDRLVVLS